LSEIRADTAGSIRPRRPPHRLFASFDLNLVQPRYFGRVGRIKCFEGAADNARDDSVAVPFTVRRNDEPGRRLGTAACKHSLVSRDVLIPMLTLGQVFGSEFPAFGGIGQPRLEPCLLLLSAVAAATLSLDGVLLARQGAG
jgi:hypothetical protein